MATYFISQFLWHWVDCHFKCITQMFIYASPRFWTRGKLRHSNCRQSDKDIQVGIRNNSCFLAVESEISLDSFNYLGVAKKLNKIPAIIFKNYIPSLIKLLHIGLSTIALSLFSDGTGELWDEGLYGWVKPRGRKETGRMCAIYSHGFRAHPTRSGHGCGSRLNRLLCCWRW